MLMSLIKRALLALVLSFGLAPAFAQVPAPVPALPDTERRTSYSISGTTCACAVNFALYGDSTDFGNWVEVFINGIRYDFSDSTHGWTITSPSGSLGTLARPITNAVLTFNAVQTGTVQIVGARRPRRAAQFAENTGVSARNLNQVFTDIIAQNREIWDKTNDMTGRGLFSQPGNTIGPLPLPAACQNKFLGFDATGLQPVCALASGGGGTGGDTLTVGTTAVVGGVTNGILYTNGAVLGNLATANNGVLTTNGAGVPSITTSISLNGATAPGAGMIWGINTQNGFTSWQIRNQSNGNNATSAFTTGNDNGTADFICYSSTFAAALFTNRCGIIAGSALDGLLFTTVGAKSIDFAIANVKVGSFTTAGLLSLVSALPVTSGGTNCLVASGTCLDNITGFASTGFIQRIGAGTYSFTLPAAGIATWLATPSSANLAAALTDETGTGFAVFSASPALTGTPTAPTAAVDTNTTQIATTAMVLAQAAAATPLGTNPTAAVGTSTRYARGDHVHPGREVLSANRTYFVRSDGSDASCNGVSNASSASAPACAFQTWGKAVTNLVSAIDFNGKTVTITNGNAATYAAGIAMTQGWVGGGLLVFDLGAGAINAGVAAAFADFSFPGAITIQNGTLSGVTGISHGAMGTIQLGTGLTFGTCTSRHMQATTVGSQIQGAFVSYNISGGALSHYFAVDGGKIVVPGVTGTFTGNAAFGTTNFDAFASAKNGGLLLAGSGTYPVGAFTITGRRYFSGLNGYIDPNGSAVAGVGTLPNYFPGNAVGVGTNAGVTPWGLYNG